MSVIKIKNEQGEFVDITVLQGPKGETGDTGPQGPKGDTGAAGQNGTSVSVIEATSESNAITLSQQNPNNIYYWSE